MGVVSINGSLRAYVFSYLPMFLLSFSIPILFISSEEKYYTLINIMILCLFTHSIAVILNYFDIFSIPELLESTFVEEYEGELRKQSKFFIRSGIFRVNGISSGVISEGYYLATLAIFSLTRNNNNPLLLNIIMFPLLITAIFFTGSRSAIIVLVFS